MKSWPQPKSVKQVRGFFGLTDYYRRLIERYAQIEALLTNLLKKDGFQWGDKALVAYLSIARGSGAIQDFFGDACGAIYMNLLDDAKSANKRRFHQLSHAGELLQPLAISTAIWEDIAMDFITGLPTVGGKINHRGCYRPPHKILPFRHPTNGIHGGDRCRMFCESNCETPWNSQ